jgi:3-oxosteroid 1-dehydrogenase
MERPAPNERGTSPNGPEQCRGCHSDVVPGPVQVGSERVRNSVPLGCDDSMKVDVIVVGSGAGALIAAGVAASSGAEVMVLEKSSKLGGGSALSTGLVFAPASSYMRAAGIEDSPKDALRYLRRLNGGLASAERLQRFLTTQRALLEWLETEASMGLRVIPDLPDFHPEFEGGKHGGRHLAAEPFDGHVLGEWADRTRRSQSLPLTYYEIEEMGGPAKVKEWDFELIAERIGADVRAQGAALVAPLVAHCLAHGVELRTEASVTALLRTDDRVSGVQIGTGDAAERVEARRAVILGTGGFEWDQAMNRQYLGMSLPGPLTVPSNEGDGHRMAMRQGAGLSMMQEAVWSPVLHVPGEEYDGRPFWRNLASEKGRPHSLMVNRAGRRFANESLNYVDIGHVFRQFDSSRHEFPNLSAFLVFDAAYKATYPVATAMPGEGAPEWMHQASSLRLLASEIGVDASHLVQTVTRFNKFATDGRDADFGRGSTSFEQYYGDPANSGPNPTLGRIDQPPFYAVSVELGSFGNRGGVTASDDGQVLDVDGRAIAGLFACGNTMAQTVLGQGYEGGGTLAQSMTYGFASARANAGGRS